MTTAGRYVSRRWCSACAWEGVGRSGPELQPGRPISHESGFRFGEDVLGPNLGFEWGGQPEEPLPRPRGLPNHPSGFRFAAAPPSE